MCGIWCTILFEHASQNCPVCATDSKLFNLKLDCDQQGQILRNDNNENCRVEQVETDDENNLATIKREVIESIKRMKLLHNRRGPDCNSNTFDSCLQIQNAEPEVKKNESSLSPLSPSPSTISNGLSKVHLSGHVLWTQGPEPVPQPYANIDSTKYLLFNGDIYSFSGSRDYDDSHFHPEKVNDGLMLFEKLQQVFQSNNYDNELCSLVASIRGPFAFVYLDKDSNKIWFGRDFFGRESLLFSYYKSESKSCIWNISSVSVYKDVFEIPTAGIYEMDLISKTFKVIPYSSHSRVDVLENLTNFGKFLKSAGCNVNFDSNNKTKIELTISTKLRTLDWESSLVLKQLCELAEMKHLEPSDLLIKAAEILDNYVGKLLQHLRRSVRLRMKAVAPTCRHCRYNPPKLASCKDHSTIGVLFSGGLDSTVLAYLTAEQSCSNNSIELINVAFAKDGNYNNCPDRQTSLEAYRVLKDIFEPLNKPLHLVLVDETKEEIEKMRRERVKDLISPLKSVLDDSLGCCLWFATRGRRKSPLSPEANQKDSSIKTVFLGSGADELFGGYGRHRSAFERGGWKALDSEMQLDLDRISIRNMGRDNRVISDHGVCPRFPFLDEEVVHFLTQDCDIWVKCCPLLGDRGLGEKLLLRATALKLLGKLNVNVALFPKRAMQFGSRIAKLENSKEKGGDSCNRLL